MSISKLPVRVELPTLFEVTEAVTMYVQASCTLPT